MRALAFALTALTLAAPAGAQDGSEAAQKRTVEGAQQFFAEALLKGGWEALSFDWFDGATHHFFKDGWQTSQERIMTVGAQAPVYGEILSIQTPSRCLSILTVDAKVTRGSFIEDPRMPITPKKLVVILDWSRMNPVKAKPETMLSRARDGETVNTMRTNIWVWDPKVKSGVAFQHGESSVAQRLAFAMEFLQENCAEKSDTGF